MDIQQMMQQAKVMQDRMQQMQEELADREVNGESGGGLVKVVMTCKGDVRGLDISPEVIDRDDKETLEDLVMAAINILTWPDRQQTRHCRTKLRQ
jgi:DNA-binding YbaB/EbfC family protein